MFSIHYDYILKKMNFYFNTIGLFFLFSWGRSPCLPEDITFLAAFTHP